MLSLKRIIRSIIVRMGIYFDLVEPRNDLRYKTPNTHIGVNVSLGNLILEGNNSLDHDVQIQGNVTLGLCSTLGHHAILQGGDISIGRYSQIAPYVAMYAQDHPTDYMTIYVNKRLMDGNLQSHSTKSPIYIGHDVWIGHGAILLKGITIGNGAIVGAGSVVTKNIPDYCIVAGNPARIIRKRFDDEIIGLLQTLKWWEIYPAELYQYKNIFNLNINQNRQEALLILRKYIAKKEEHT